jgi:hypothetical protein
MATLEQLVTIFRKECEDMIYANQIATYLIQYGTVSASSGDTSINFDTAYGNTEYEIHFFEATDVNDIDIRDAITITDKTSSGFTFNLPRAAEIRWQAHRRTPIFNHPLGTFWT